MFDVFRREFTVHRKIAGTYIDGYWTEAPGKIFTISASIQATEGEVLETLPEGYRTRESYTLFTATELQTSTKSFRTPDTVLIPSAIGISFYLVAKVTPWQHLEPTKHYEVVVVKENVDIVPKVEANAD